MKILALDLGKFKTMACLYDSESLAASYGTIRTAPLVLHSLIAKHAPRAGCRLMLRRPSRARRIISMTGNGALATNSGPIIPERSLGRRLSPLPPGRHRKKPVR